jgi:hypothetical protein
LDQEDRLNNNPDREARADLLRTDSSSDSGASKKVADLDIPEEIELFLSQERAYVKRLEVFYELLVTLQKYMGSSEVDIISQILCNLIHYHRQLLGDVHLYRTSGSVQEFETAFARHAEFTNHLKSYFSKQDEGISQALSSYSALRAAVSSLEHIQITARRSYLTWLLSEPLLRLASYIALSKVFPTLSNHT